MGFAKILDQTRLLTKKGTKWIHLVPFSCLASGELSPRHFYDFKKIGREKQSLVDTFIAFCNRIYMIMYRYDTEECVPSMGEGST